MAACTNCGKDISPMAVSCPACGHPGPGGQRAVIAMPSTGSYEPWSVAALASGIAGLSVLPFIGSVLGIVFGHMARGRLRENPSLEGAGFATAGIVLGWVGVGLGILAFLFFFVILGALFSSI